MKKGKFFKNLFIILVFLFLLLPIIVLVIYSFNTSKMNIVFEGFTFEWYKTLLSNKRLLEAFFNTLLISFVSTSVSTIIGTISAWGLYKYDFPLKKFINRLLYIPIVIPEIVLGISLLSVFTLMKLNFGIFTIILSHIIFSVPFVIVSVRSSFDPKLISYEEAARDLGANTFVAFNKVILPIIMPGVISGATLALTLSLDDVVISYFTAGPSSNTLPLYIYSIIKSGINPSVNALTTIMIIVVFIILLLSTIFQIKRSNVK